MEIETNIIIKYIDFIIFLKSFTKWSVTPATWKSKVLTIHLVQ